MKQMIVLLSSLLITLMCSVNLNAQWYEKSNGLPINCWAAAIDAYDSLIATGPYTKTSDYIPDSLYVTTNGGNKSILIAIRLILSPFSIPIRIMSSFDPI